MGIYTKLVTKAIAGIKAQGGGSHQTDNPGYCLYRAPNGRKCGIGQLITDEVYNRYNIITTGTRQSEGISGNSLEGNSAVADNVLRALEASGVPNAKAHAMLLRTLQQAHDSAATLALGNDATFLTEFETRLSYVLDMAREADEMEDGIIPPPEENPNAVENAYQY